MSCCFKIEVGPRIFRCRALEGGECQYNTEDEGCPIRDEFGGDEDYVNESEERI